MKTAIQRGTAVRSEHDPRTAALRIVDKTLTGKDASQALLDKALRESKMTPTDKGLCTELVYGYLRSALRLEWQLGTFLKTPEKLPAEMRLILGLAAYEIAHLRIPAHASVNWAVTRVRNRFGKGLAGVANGVLRSFSREAKTFRDDSRYAGIEERAERLSVMHSLPVWVVRLWLDAYGEERALAFMRASSGQAVSAVRINRLREDAAATRANLAAEGGVSVGDWGLAFPAGVPYAARALEKKGALSFQSASVQEILSVFGMPSWSGPIWDACAGSGGKTAAMLECGLDVRAASDISRVRLERAGEELVRLGLASPALLAADASNPPDAPVFSEKFALILADVPCSGLGTLSRRPEIRYRRTDRDIADLIAAQDAILDSAATRLLPGGRIAYVTCTLNPMENEERVETFLARHAGFSLVETWTTPTDSPWREFFFGAMLQFL